MRQENNMKNQPPCTIILEILNRAAVEKEAGGWCRGLRYVMPSKGTTCEN